VPSYFPNPIFMRLTLDQAQSIVEIYIQRDNEIPRYFKHAEELPFSKADIKDAIKYLILLFITLRGQKDIDDIEYIKELGTHKHFYKKLAIYFEDVNLLNRVQNNIVVNEAFENCMSDVEILSYVESANVTASLLEDTKLVLDMIYSYELEIKKYIKEKQTRN
jgi:ATP-dependent phosphoenolpyruvate carboxykinase